MRLRRWFGTALFFILGFLFLTMSVLAYWSVSGTAHNVITTGSFCTELMEEYNPPGSVYPGMNVDKVVNVKNSGTADAVIRIRFEKRFGVRDEAGKFHEAKHLNQDLIEISCNTAFWKEMDGYWYYKEVLKAGEETKGPLFQSFHVSENADNRYKGMDAEIVVYLESIQAEADALSLWETSEDELRIYYEFSEEEIQTTVAFEGKENGFVFTGTETNLFANFQNLIPGCSRTQEIQIWNQSEDTTEIALHAEIPEHEKLSAEEIRYLEQLLNEYAQIQIFKGTEILYKGSINGAGEHKENKSMLAANPIVLGTYGSQQKELLKVVLSVSPEAQHEFGSLIGRINWIFTAKGSEDDKDSEDNISPISAAVPKTGDTSQLRGLLIAAAASVFLMIVCLLFQIQKYKHLAEKGNAL